MKGILIALIATGMALTAPAQTDTTGKDRTDTIKIGGMVIIKRPGKDSTGKGADVTIHRGKRQRSNIHTNWWVFDLGFANYSDETNYVNSGFSGFTGPGVNEESMKLRTAKSVNVSIWMFMQRLNIIKHVVNLKYGLGVELNNYRFDNPNILIQKNPIRIILNTPPANERTVKKNKLAADYVTVPLMLNFNFTPKQKHGFGFSAGVSGGYLYSARQKLKYSDGEKDKTHGNFNLNKWKVSYIGELSLGPVRLYGSMATKSMWEKGLDQTPYNAGIRFSHF